MALMLQSAFGYIVVVHVFRSGSTDDRVWGRVCLAFKNHRAGLVQAQVCLIRLVIGLAGLDLLKIWYINYICTSA